MNQETIQPENAVPEIGVKLLISSIFSIAIHIIWGITPDHGIWQLIILFSVMAFFVIIAYMMVKFYTWLQVKHLHVAWVVSGLLHPVILFAVYFFLNKNKIHSTSPANPSSP